MCLLAVCHRTLPDAPIALAANREERYDRPSRGPHVLPGTTRVVGGLDVEAGGTWLGVNEHGVVVAVTNRHGETVPPAPRSRGLLCRELLTCRTAVEAGEHATRELATRRYAGANFVCLDRRHGVVVHGGARVETIALPPGLHVLANGDLNDPDDERLAWTRVALRDHVHGSAEDFLAAAAAVCADTHDPHAPVKVVLRGAERGTVSSDLIAVTSDPRRAVYRHADRAPDRAPYDDCSHLLREVLVAGVAA